MIFLRGCPRAVTSTLAAVLLLFLVVLVFRSKSLYEDFQKANRLQSYEKYMEEITELLNQAEEGADFGKSQLEKLDKVVGILENSTKKRVSA
ncbi:Hypothetical predicted protein [Cloeon dipterum]|uniref:Uncharacterized protein n=1 Tax=Cloeon dipterum TaxID=197152 RepID=A0A8S1DEF0_9INSE|nr:Hypothetical predicted protein [Cloeon dipterum]